MCSTQQEKNFGIKPDARAQKFNKMDEKRVNE